MSGNTRSVVLGLITILCWGSLATFSNLLIHVPPFFVLGVCFLFGGLPGVFSFREMFPGWKVSLLGIAGYFGYHFFLFYSFRYAPAIEANLINYLWPVIMVVVTPAFFKGEGLKWYHILGACLSVIGSVVLIAGKGGQIEAQYITGYLLAFGAAITWPAYSIGKKKLGPTSIWAVSGYCIGASALCFLTHFLIEPRVVLQGRDAWMLLFMGLGPFGIAFYFWDLALRAGDPKVIGALAYLTPVISTLGLVLFAGQTISKTTGIAMALIIGGASSGLLDFVPRKK